MLTIDQVHQLENRVEKAVSKITSLLEEREQLNSENANLRGQLSALQTRMTELEKIVQTFKEDQGKIEAGILSALDKLSAFEDSILSQGQGEAGGQDFSAPAAQSGETQEAGFSAGAPDGDSAQPSSGQSDFENGFGADTGYGDNGAENAGQDAPASNDSGTYSGDGQMDIF